MKIAIRGKNIKLTDALQAYVNDKVKKIGKYFDRAEIDVQVSLEVKREKHIVEVTAYVNGLILRGEEATDDMYASIDGVIEKIERQIRKYKTRINRKLRKDEVDISIESDDPKTEDLIVKVKRFSFKPMLIEEAVMQMDLLGHDFFVFSNATSEEMNVVYKRKDGKYGLIEPA